MVTGRSGRLDGLRVPFAEAPRVMLWDNGTDEHNSPVEVSWWEATRAKHGGRDNVPVVISSNSKMYAFNSRGAYVGVVKKPASFDAPGPYAPEFWPYTLPAGRLYMPWLKADTVRPASVILACVDGVLGLTDGASPSSTASAWRIAYGFLLLGYYPPMGLGIAASGAAFKVGVDEVGDRAARRIKRAILGRLALERRHLRQRAEDIERNWR
jgi:hypothetical protein